MEANIGAFGPEFWCQIAEKSALLVGVVITVVYGVPFLKWMFVTYVPSKTAGAASSPAPISVSSVRKAGEDDVVIAQLLHQMEKNSSAILELAKNVASLTEAQRQSNNEMFRLVEGQKEQTNRMESQLQRIEGRLYSSCKVD